MTVTERLRLIVFDVDGTLVDSQDHILTAMSAAFDNAELEMPDRQALLSIVGLSLPEAMARLVPDAEEAVQAQLVIDYKHAYSAIRVSASDQGLPPPYPGVDPLIKWLSSKDWVLTGIATGKSRRGLTHLLASTEWDRCFVTTQTADEHPSKPHPAMLQTALVETGVEAKDAVMIGDTTFDIEMAKAAGMAAIGVTWGYHPAAYLHGAGADCLVDDAGMLGQVLSEFCAGKWERPE